MKIFKAIIEDNDDVYKVIRPAKSVAEFKSTYGGNGEFVKISEVSDFSIPAEKVSKAIDNADFSQTEKAILLAILQDSGILS